MYESKFHQCYLTVCYQFVMLAQTFLMPQIQNTYLMYNITKYLFSI